ncbi:CAP domain-containing protein [Phormidium sp. FACHB-1136]|uniref:CAP domain-containing protein n=1 Tax=Phormidium sp. FACHB-1136 TaxID=2692848 RepID=UPI001682D5EC|nr:CAP domain-containing protein [Phormidium sp. FACHB-1136]MBD2426071.1 CAP domain-containing protein [Phormidium sp. FACHB-1136]
MGTYLSQRSGWLNRLALVLIAGCFVGFAGVSPVQANPGQPRPARLTLAQAETSIPDSLLTLVNAERQRAGVAPLRLNDKLATAAQRHAEDMAATRNLSHQGSDGSTMRSRIDATGYGWMAIGENVAMGQTSPEAVMRSWMNSAGHRRNILNPNFQELGVGYAEGGGRPYWVQVFAKPR